MIIRMTEKRVRLDSMEQATALYGTFDENIKIVERIFGVNCVNRDSEDGSGGCLIVSGSDALRVDDACGALEYLKNMVKLQDTLSAQSVEYVCGMFSEGRGDELEGLDSDCVCVTVKGKPIKPRTVGQRRYVEAIRKNTVVLGIGPAGTGKTFLAVAMAVTALRSKQISRIVLTRPAVEAGEKLGFLPGDLQNKIDPYLRPLYDALFELLGPENYQRHKERGTIEIAPLAYMRGRTLDSSFIILDEAQNTTPEQMKMFLTRLGYGSKAVVTGDMSQTDLPSGQKSGLAIASSILRDISGIGIFSFTSRDVVRHPLVRRIIDAYEKYDKAAMAKRKGSKNEEE